MSCAFDFRLFNDWFVPPCVCSVYLSLCVSIWMIYMDCLSISLCLNHYVSLCVCVCVSVGGSIYHLKKTGHTVIISSLFEGVHEGGP